MPETTKGLFGYIRFFLAALYLTVKGLFGGRRS